MTPRRLLLLVIFLWCLAIVATPLLAAHDGIASSAASAAYVFFFRICHQLDSHSFHLDGNKFPVCIRCFSIYCAFFVGVMFMPWISRTPIRNISSRMLLINSLLPMGVDVLMAIIGIHESTTLTRVVTGSVFGFVLGILFAPILEELIGQFISRIAFLKAKRILRRRRLRNLQSA